MSPESSNTLHNQNDLHPTNALKRTAFLSTATKAFFFPGKCTQKTEKSQFKILLWFMIFAVVGMVLYARLWPDAPYTSPDTQHYLQAADDLRDFHISHLQHRPPGYPLVLILTNSLESPGRLLFFAQMGMHFACIILLATQFARMRIHIGLIGVFALLAFLPPWVAPTACVLSESTAEFFLVLGTTSLLAGLRSGERRWQVVAGTAFAFAALTRPAYQFISIAIIGTLVVLAIANPVFRRKWRTLVSSSICLLLTAAFLIGSLVFYNHKNFGLAGLTPFLGGNLCTRTVRYYERLPDEYAESREILIKHRDEALIKRGSDHNPMMSVWTAIPEIQHKLGLNTADLCNRLVKANLVLIRKAPVNYLIEVGQSIVTYWFPRIGTHASFGSRKVDVLWLLLHFLILGVIFFYCIILSGAICLARCLSPRWWAMMGDDDNHSAEQLAAIGITVTIIFYTMVISTTLETGNPRYRSPTDILILALLPLLISTWRQLRRTARQGVRDGDGAP